jgi:hypothetical protein
MLRRFYFTLLVLRLPGNMSEEVPHQFSVSESYPDKPLFCRNEVLQTSNEVLYEKLKTLAIQFGILGYTDTAANLIGTLNNHDWYHRRHTVVRPLHILWDQKHH